MINLAQILEGKPMLVTNDLYFYQPTLSEIMDMTEQKYWSLLNLWLLKRTELIKEENEVTRKMDDFDLWKAYMMSSPLFKNVLSQSCEIFLKTKIEFFEISNTIFIGEKESGVILDNTLYLLMKEICTKLIPVSSASEEGEQYHETENMSERERQMIEKMKASSKKIEETKNPDKKPEDYLGSKIIGLVAIGKYTFEEVYKMTMLQFNMLLQKYIDIQSFELRTALSPYISSEDGQTNKFWLD